MNIKSKIRHYFAKKIFFFLTKWADPESPIINKRLLIAIGTKKINSNAFNLQRKKSSNERISSEVNCGKEQKASL